MNQKKEKVFLNKVAILATLFFCVYFKIEKIKKHIIFFGGFKISHKIKKTIKTYVCFSFRGNRISVKHKFIKLTYFFV